MTKITTIFFFIIGLIIFYFVAYKSRPARNKQGDVLGDQFENATNEFTIGTYNIQSGKNINGQRDITKTSKIIHTCDIVAIQEVYGKPWLSKTGQVDYLAQSNQMDGLFAPTRRRWLRAHRGNALLTKVKLTDWQYLQLPDKTGKQFRNITLANIPFQNTNIKLIATHLHTSKGREAQLKYVIDEFIKHDYAILLGDLNSRKDDPQIQTLLKRTDIEDVIAQSSQMDRPERIDWILVKNLQAKPFNFHPIGVSDHPFFSVKIMGLKSLQ